MTPTLPDEFAALAPFVADWALDTQDARHARRLAASRAEIRTFYDAMLPHMPRILEVVDAHPLGTLPPALQPLFALALSLAEVAPHVELYRGDTGVPHAFEETRFVAKHGRQATWKAELPN